MSRRRWRRGFLEAKLVGILPEKVPESERKQNALHEEEHFQSWRLPPENA
jgi:hypothetical protein